MKRLLLLSLLLMILFAAPGLAQSNECKPNFVVIKTPSFVIDGASESVTAELWPTDDNKIPVISGQPRSRLQFITIGSLLGPDELSKEISIGVMHWTCIEKISDELEAFYTWTIFPRLLVTRVDSITLAGVGRDTSINLAAQNGQLMAMLRLLTADGKLIGQRSISPAFGQQQTVNIGEEFGIETWGYKLEVITPVGYPAKLRVRIEQQRQLRFAR